MKLINNIFLQQQTSTTLFVFTSVALFVFVLIIMIVGRNNKNKEIEQKENWIKSNSHKLKIQDNFLLKFISPLSKLTPKCNKCNNDVYNIWDINSYELDLRCSDCKKIYKIDLGEYSKIAIDSLTEYIDFVDESYNNSNEKIRKYLIDKLTFDFSSLRSNQPLIKAIRFLTSSLKTANSSRLNFKLIGYSNYLSFNENEYFEEGNIGFEDLDNYFDSEDSEHKTTIKTAFEENPDKDEVTVQIPALIFGIQKQVTVFKNGISENLIKEADNRTKKRSRKISQKVKDEVWNRDNGKCVECGSNEDLEFDHIIPHSKGGANTYRNIQLLCEPCNRSKSAKIG